jgi:hypothetical protein
MDNQQVQVKPKEVAVKDKAEETEKTPKEENPEVLTT